jgi:hypothetical protein
MIVCRKQHKTSNNPTYNAVKALHAPQAHNGDTITQPATERLIKPEHSNNNLALYSLCPLW